MSLFSVSKLSFPGKSSARQYGPLRVSSQGAFCSTRSRWSLSFLFESRLVEILHRNPPPQMCYQIGFCFWLLSFDTEISEQINKYVHYLTLLRHRARALTLIRKYDIIPLLIDIAKAAVKEKVIRVIIDTFCVSLYKRLMFGTLRVTEAQCRTLSPKRLPPTFLLCSWPNSYRLSRIFPLENGQTKIL